MSYILYNRLSDTISSVYDTFRHYIENATPFSPEVAAASALESDTIRLEKHKLARVQQLERRWLESALGAELEALRKLEEGSQQAAQEASTPTATKRTCGGELVSEHGRSV